MAALTDEQKLFAAQRLGAFHSLSEVVDLLREEHEVETTTAQIARYNPLTKAGEDLSAPLKQAFLSAREAFLKDRESIAICHQNFRQRERLALYRQVKRKNAPLAAQLLDHAAKEEGGLFCQRESNGPTQAEVDAYIRQMAADLKADVTNHVRSPREQKAVFKAVDERMAAVGE